MNGKVKYRVTVDNNLRELTFIFDTPQDALNFANIALMHVEKAYGNPNVKYEIVEDEDAQEAVPKYAPETAQEANAVEVVEESEEQ